MYKLFLLLSLSFMFIGCGEDSLTDANLDTPTSTLSYRKYSDNLTEMCNTTQDQFSYTCEHHPDGLIKKYNVHQHQNCISGEDFDCIFSESDIEWFDDFYENCVRIWDQRIGGLNTPTCHITTYRRLERLEEANE